MNGMPIAISDNACLRPVTRSSKLTRLPAISMLPTAKPAGLSSSFFGFARRRSMMSSKLKRCASSRTMFAVSPSIFKASITGANRSTEEIDAFTVACCTVSSGAGSPGRPSTVRPLTVTRSA